MLQSANVRHWLIGDALRDAVCFRDLLQTTRHVEFAVIGSQFQQLKAHIDLADTEQLLIVQHPSNPDILAIQHRLYQGVQYPFVVLYAYTLQDSTYSYAYNATTSIEHEEVFPTVERFIDYIALPTPHKAYRFLRDQYPFFRHGLLITAFDKPLLVLFKNAVSRDQDFMRTLKQQRVKRMGFRVSLKPRIQQ